jgi:hypothetical protein
VSRAPRPAGIRLTLRPASRSAFQTRSADVAGARDRRADTRDFTGREPVVFDALQLDAGERLHDRAGGRTLHGDECVARAVVHRDHVAAHVLDVLDDPAVVAVDAARIHDQQEMGVGESIDQQIVHERPFRGEEA